MNSTAIAQAHSPLYRPCAAPKEATQTQIGHYINWGEGIKSSTCAELAKCQ